MTQLNDDGSPYSPCFRCGVPTPDTDLLADIYTSTSEDRWLCRTCSREVDKERRPKLELFVTKMKICRSYFFEDPNRAYEILATALREIEE